MLTIRTAAQIRGAPHLKGFRSCAACTGVPFPHADSLRVAQAAASLAHREVRRRWVAQRWGAHEARLRGSYLQ